MNKKFLILVPIILLAAALLLYPYGNRSLEQDSFNVNPPLFKIVLNKGETINTDLNIKNLAEKKNFILNIGDLDHIISLDKSNLVIDKEESAHINVYISGLEASYGAHMGHISVSNGIDEKIIPFVVSVHSPKQLFGINLDVAAENKQLTKKEQLVTNIKFFNLYDGETHTLDVDYKILNVNGETVFSDSEQITMASKSSFTKKFSLPESIKTGDYVFVVSLNYLDTVTTSSYLFLVVDKKQPFSFFNINFLTWAVVIFVAITFILILFMIYERATLFSQLKKQQHEQVTSLSKKIAEEKKKRLAKAKTEEQKTKIVAELQDAKDKIINELKKQQKEHFKEFKKLQKKKNIRERKKKLIQWRKESFPKALKSAQISSDLRSKLAVLKNAYSEGFIQKDSYLKGVSKIKSADKKLKRNIYK